MGENTFGIIGIVLGVLAVAFWPLFGIAGLILCIIQFKKDHSSLAVVGIIVCILSFFLWIFINTIFWTTVVPMAAGEATSGFQAEARAGCFDLILSLSAEVVEGDCKVDSEVVVEVSRGLKETNLTAIMFREKEGNRYVAKYLRVPALGEKMNYTIPVKYEETVITPFASGIPCSGYISALEGCK